MRRWDDSSVVSEILHNSRRKFTPRHKSRQQEKERDKGEKNPFGEPPEDRGEAQ